jgi:hypothetical protein
MWQTPAIPYANVGAVFIVATNGNDILTGDTTDDTLAPAAMPIKG